MAGITAASASVEIEAGDTATNKVQAGWVTNEQITLGTSPAGSTYSWGLSRPAGSGATLSSATVAAPTVTPDVAGEYVITVTVDSSTSYTLRCTVTTFTAGTAQHGIRFLPVADSTVPTPTSGVILYYSSDQSGLAQKDSAGDVSTVDITSI